MKHSCTRGWLNISPWFFAAHQAAARPWHSLAHWELCLIWRYVIGHVRVPKTLTFKMRPSAQPLLWKWVFICMRIEKHFRIKGWALNLVLIQRPGGTRKWPISKVEEISLAFFGFLQSQFSIWPKEHCHLTKSSACKAQEVNVQGARLDGCMGTSFQTTV